MNIELRKDIERKIIRTACIALIDHGYQVELYDGEETAVPMTDKVGDILKEIMATDEEILKVFEHNKVINEWKQIGFVLLIYGNDGWDVIADHSVHLEEILKPAFDHAGKLEDMYS